jgi:hypothetical protein
MNQFAPFALMILYAAILLLVAKPLDKWRESRINEKLKVSREKQGELFEPGKVDKDHPLVASQR